MSTFQITGLPLPLFSWALAATQAELRGRNAACVTATSKPGFPCRVSLLDAEVGEELILLPFEHQPAPTPYRSSGPIFVRRAAVQAHLEPGVVPDSVRSRLISLRAYDADHLMTEARVCEGNTVALAIETLFASDQVAYIHLHNAQRGCFACAVARVGPLP